MSIRPDRKEKILIAQYKKAIKEKEPYFKLCATDNVSELYALLYNMKGTNDELADGEYLVKLNISGLPFKPIDFTFYTPNGIFMTHNDICTSISKYHAANHISTLGIRGFITELTNGMMCYNLLGGGIGIIGYADEKNRSDTVKKYAKQSKLFNAQKYPEILKQIEQQFAEYSTKWT